MGQIRSYFSGFSGIGGFELGIRRASNEAQEGQGTRSQKGQRSQRADQRPNGLACVGFSEIDKYAAHIYRRHFPNHRNYGDITRIKANALPDFDLYVGGFPCQAFSVAGRRRGFDDTRGTLFFEVARLLAAKRPRVLLLENVKGLLSHDGGRTFKTIIAALVELGYGVEWQVLNSKDFGVPQSRERVFIVGHLGGDPPPKVFPIAECGEEDTCERGGVADTGRRQPVIAVPLKFLGRNQKNLQGEYSFTVDTAQTGGIAQGGRIRRLTPVECERLQGFPDGWTEGISDTQRFKCLGNAVTVNVVEAIMTKLLGSGAISRPAAA